MNLKEELHHLLSVERPTNIRAIEEARAHGDLSENAEYHAAKERQAFIEGRIMELQDVLARAEVIKPEGGKNSRIAFGVKVLLYDFEEDKEVTFRLVGPYESDPEKGCISVYSPLGQALIGKKVGDEIKVPTPSGLKEFEILDII
ncbi:MAG: transcription elongation factor GreA [Desulfatiglandales bacterium]